MNEEMTQTTHSENPAWFDGKKINEALFCEEFLRDYPMITVKGGDKPLRSGRSGT